MNKKNIWTIVIIVIVVLLLIFAFTRFRATRDAEDETDNNTSTDSALIIDAQDPEQLGATFDRVNLDEDGFIVIRGVVNGNAGIIIGTSRLLEAGEHEDVQVLMELVPEQEYEAQIYIDNGNGVFDEESDSLVLTDSGLAASARFNVNPAEDFVGK